MKAYQTDMSSLQNFQHTFYGFVLMRIVGLPRIKDFSFTNILWISKNEEAAIGYFKRNPEVFYNLEKEMNIYRPSFNDGGVWLENTKELIMIKD